MVHDSLQVSTSFPGSQDTQITGRPLFSGSQALGRVFRRSGRALGAAVTASPAEKKKVVAAFGDGPRNVGFAIGN